MIKYSAIESRSFARALPRHLKPSIGVMPTLTVGAKRELAAVNIAKTSVPDGPCPAIPHHLAGINNFLHKVDRRLCQIFVDWKLVQVATNHKGGNKKEIWKLALSSSHCCSEGVREGSKFSDCRIPCGQ